MEEGSSIGGYYLVTVAAFILALGASASGLLWYRFLVRRLMRAAVQPATSANPPENTPVAPSSPLLEGGWRHLSQRLRQSEHRSLLTYGVSGIMAALTASLLMSAVAFDAGSLPVRALVLLAGVYAWPLVFVLTVACTYNARRALLTAAMLLGIVIVVALWMAVVPAKALGGTATTGSSVNQALVLWAGTQLIPTVATWLVLNRWTRAVGPLMLVFTLLVVTLTHAALTATLARTGLVGAAVLLVGGVEIGGWPYPSSVALQLLGGVAIGLVVGLPAAWTLNRVIANRYQGKQESDQTVFADAVWTIFAMASAPSLFLGGGAWVLAALLIPVVHKVATVVLFTRARSNVPERGPELLWLRRFAGGRAVRRTYSGLNALWRSVGPVHLISAPDVAWQTVEPYRFLDFLAGRLHRHFIATPAALAKRLEDLDLARDRDGRFRANEFFCQGDVWESAVKALITRSQLIAMDLRGIGKQVDPGIRKELTFLADLGRFDCLVVLCAKHERSGVASLLAALAPTLPLPRILHPGRSARSIVEELFRYVETPATL